MAATTTIWDVLLWLVGGTAIWAVASIPGYWLLGAIVLAREGLTAVLGRVSAAFAGSALVRAQKAGDTRDRLLGQVRVTELDSSTSHLWNTALEQPLRDIREGAAQLAEARVAASRTAQTLEKITSRMRRSTLAEGVIPEIPPSDEMLRRARRNRVALVNLIASTVLLIPIFAANAQLTGLVLGESLPPVQPILGIPVAYAIAIVIVVAEAAIGLLNSAATESLEGSERRLSFAVMFWSLMGLAVITLETVLYSQVQSSGSLGLPFGASAFGLVGFVLGASVFGLGHLAHRSIATIRKDRTPKALARQLHRLREAADEWTITTQRLQPAHAAALQAMEGLTAIAHKTAEVQTSAIEQVQLALRNAQEVPPSWANPTNRTLNRPALLERASRVYLWSGIWVIAALSLMVLCAAFSRGGTPIIGLAVGVGLSMTSFAVGALTIQHAPRRPLWKWMIFIVAFIVVGTFVSLAGSYLRGALTPHSGAMLVPATTALIAGLQTGVAISLIVLPILWLRDKTAATAAALVVGLLWIVASVVAIVEYSVRLIAWPATSIVSIFLPRRPETAPSI